MSIFTKIIVFECSRVDSPLKFENVVFAKKSEVVRMNETLERLLHPFPIDKYSVRK